MAKAPQFSPLDHEDDVVSRVQDQLAKTLDPLVASPLNGAVLVQGVTVREGLNEVPHLLSRVPQGYFVVGQHGVLQPVGWTTMTLTAPFAALGAGWPSPAYRVTAQGRVECRGLFAAAGAPVLGQNFWAYPSALLAPSSAAAATGRLFAVPVSANGGAYSMMGRFDAANAALMWQAQGNIPNQAFGLVGVYAAIASVTFGSLDGISWDAVGTSPVVLASAQDKNPTPASTYRLVSTGTGIVDLIFF